MGEEEANIEVGNMSPEYDPIGQLKDTLPNGDIRYPSFADIIVDEARGCNIELCPVCVERYPANSRRRLNVKTKEVIMYCGKCQHRITVRSEATRRLCLRLLKP